MALHLRTVAHGTPAADELRRALGDAKAGDPLRATTVVVPSNTVGVAARRRLASGALGPVVEGRSGLAAVTFLTVYRLAELLGSPALAAAGRRPVSTPVLAAAFRAVLADDPGVFASVAHHPATEEALVAAHRELRDLSPTALGRLSATSRRSADVVRLHRQVTGSLAARWYDEADLFDAALQAVDAHVEAGGPGGTGVEELGAVVVHLPASLTRAAGRLIARLADATDVAVVAALTGHPDADADVRTALARCGVADDELATAAGRVEPATPAVSRLVSASDADEEARLAVRAVVEATRAGTPLDRIAVVHPSDDPYARLLVDHLERAGIAHNGPSVRPLRERVAGRALLALLGLADQDHRRDAVFDLLADLPRHGPTGQSPATQGPISRWPVTQWEVLSREAGVVGGLGQWHERLGAHAAALRAAGDERRAAQVDWLLDELDRLVDGVRPGPWSERCARLAATLHRLIGAPDERSGWPLEERRAADRVDDVLARLATLDTVEPDPSPAAMARTIELELDADLGRDGRVGDGIVVGPLSSATGLDLDLVVVVGLAEGTLPGRPADDALIPDGERRATDGELRLRAARQGSQHHQLLAALAAADGPDARRVLLAPRGDLRRSAERVLSRWAVETGAPVEVVPSHAATLTSVGHPATPQEWRVRALRARPADVAPFAAVDPALRRALELTTARASSAFTRFDGNLAGAVERAGIRRPTDPDAVISPTALEAWVRCPFHYFVDKVLRVRPVENPEARVVIDPLDYGTLVHAVLGDLVDEAVLTEADDERAVARAAAIADRRCDEVVRLGLVGHPLYWERRRRRLLADLEVFLRRDRDHLRATGFVPRHAELRFGRDGEVEPVELALPDGRAVRILGSVDRIDRDPEGRLRVIDYKTGKSESYRRTIGGDDPLAGSTRLQLPAYALAARAALGDPGTPVHACYSFPTSAGGFCEVGYEVDHEVLDSYVAAVDRIVAGIEAGVFTPHPDASTRMWVSCTSCDPDGLGVAELRRSWLDKCADPALADYVGLVEPELLEAESSEAELPGTGGHDEEVFDDA